MVCLSHQMYESINEWQHFSVSQCSCILILQILSFALDRLKLWRSRRVEMPTVPATVTPGCTCTTVSNVYVLSLDDGGANSAEKIELLSPTEDGQTCVYTHTPQETELFLPSEAFVVVK